MYLVEGGHHSDFTFSKVEKYESYGPFDTYQEAYDAWKANMWRNVDDGQHRLFIKKVIQMRPPTDREDHIRLMKQRSKLSG